ncbi:hypothetical protein H257_16954 [Aphanomyces astaci]|uniref:Uncharacterized protein n=1 Tax=Aphanomyces astaci TaxID=112090 RepID=W4FGT2_APHAT|nr:hypothetical protein H257_16954 [Aphanomyces astaci]ETV66650.1 hypothetical protein H257_16954 [Aphanomyces astaci]|eukprot:XP_009843878.1 hypothetical protein H257_16954 [Aphanomyces astaci]
MAWQRPEDQLCGRDQDHEAQHMKKKRIIGGDKQMRKLDQKSQTLFAYIVSSPDPLEMASVRAQAREIWPEWLDKSHSTWKCGDNFRKSCTCFVQRHFPEKFNNRLRLTSADASHIVPSSAGALWNPTDGTNPAERGHLVPFGDGAPLNPANGTPSHAAVDIDNANQPLLHPSSTNCPDSHRETDNDDEDVTSVTFQDGTPVKLANRDEYGLGYKHIDNIAWSNFLERASTNEGSTTSPAHDAMPCHLVFRNDSATTS